MVYAAWNLHSLLEHKSAGGLVYRRVTRVAVPIATFVAGVLAQLLADRLTNRSINTPNRIIAAALGGLAIVVVILTIIIAFDYSDRLKQLNLLGDSMEQISRRFGLSVEFVPDHPGPDDGMTYERTRQIIAHAERSLVFVDFYTESGAYRTNRGVSHSRRRAFYEEILRQIDTRTGRHMDGAAFHRRIIQAELTESEDRIVLTGDDSYLLYLRKCVLYQEASARSTVVKICPPHVRMHFAIIDDRYVILPILTTGPGGAGLRRHGALIFEDLVGDLVKTLNTIYEMLDATARPLTRKELEQPDN